MELTRRELLKLPVAAAVAGGATIHSAYAATPYSMPGLYPGRVIGIEHSASSINLAYQTGAIQLMIRRGMMELTGQPNYISAWRKLFQPGDVVGIKVNPNGGSQVSSSPACVNEVLSGLLVAGVQPRDIVFCERYQWPLANITRWLPAWVRSAYGSPGDYVDDQTSLYGPVNGYDADHYVDLPQYLKTWQSPVNPLHTRSHTALFLTKQVTKIISLTTLKDHQASGVTLNLKNMAIGCHNNTNRFHDNYDANHRLVSNLLDTIPLLVSMPVVRNKVVLGIIDGVHGLCNGGPVRYAEVEYGFVWEHKAMYFATDVVAADRIGWRAVDTERVRRGMLPEEIAGADGYDLYDVRQPQHITVAGQQYGLGEWRDDHIDYRHIKIA